MIKRKFRFIAFIMAQMSIWCNEIVQDNLAPNQQNVDLVQDFL